MNSCADWPLGTLQIATMQTVKNNNTDIWEHLTNTSFFKHTVLEFYVP